jgi:hypothetical protein
MWDPQHLSTLWASTACYRDTFTLLLLIYIRLEVRPLTFTVLIMGPIIISGTEGDFDLSGHHTHIWGPKIQRFEHLRFLPDNVSDYGQRNRRCSPKSQIFTPENTSPHKSPFFVLVFQCHLGCHIVWCGYTLPAPTFRAGTSIEPVTRLY